MRALLERQRAAFQRSPYPSLGERREKLRALRAALRRRQDALCDAIAQDFGGRSRTESLLADVLGPVLEINHALAHLRRWMKPARRRVELLFYPNRAWVEYQPKGVVGIISPWNFPGYLTLGPLVAALAAGNRAMIKMSELTPATAEAMKRLLAECFGEDEVALTGGDAEVGKAFAALAFDHLVFTGSTEVGRAVMRAAAENLVPVTLELGGKSPAIVSRSADLAAAATRIVHGKVFNSGQICVSPDYALVPRELRPAFLQAARAAFERLAPRPAGDPDYTSIVSNRHAARLQGLLDDARALGASVQACAASADARRMPLHLVTEVTDAMRIAREEVFGPLLPVLAYEGIDDAAAYVAARPRPLALYYFGHDREEAAALLRRTHSGGVTLNDWGWHVLQHDLPFGGIGASGMGSYHGEEGFRALSHARSMFSERRFFPVGLFYPPYGRFAQRLVLRLFLGTAS
ncbi:MAG TPA: coniferyl aldehyde dehydrogenase [Burkholderiales bacterium]|nr:coniferyl aldehyde dehydrogenase [Burkholderiales bacterium]